MIDPVKPRRRYESGRRATQAADTKNAVIDAARALFISSGWQATTIAGIAKAAGVSPETIYATFRNKQAVLQAVVERAVRGNQPERPLLEQAGPMAIAHAADQQQQIELFARDISRVLANVADVMAVVRTAAETDPDLAQLYRALHEGRRRNLGFVAAALAATGACRNGMGEAEVTAHIWRLASPELYLLMTKVEGLTQEAYTGWLGSVLRRQLL
jgi:AcrR family transcriptional regulator